MKSLIEKVAVIGTGVIGTGWIIRFLFNKKKISFVSKINTKKMNIINPIKENTSATKNSINIHYVLMIK